MNWEIKIEGRDVDLEALARTVNTEALSIQELNNKFFLTWPGMELISDPSEVEERASSFLRLISGAAYFGLGRECSLRVAGVANRLADGKRQVFVGIKETMKIGFTVGALIGVRREDGSVAYSDPRDCMSSWLDLATRDSNVAKVLRLFDANCQDWVSLFRILEVIEEDVKGADAIENRGWAKKSHIRIFKHTANSVAASGDLARHGKEETQPPKQPMRLEIARAFIKYIAAAWLHEKGSKIDVE